MKGFLVLFSSLLLILQILSTAVYAARLCVLCIRRLHNSIERQASSLYLYLDTIGSYRRIESMFQSSIYQCRVQSTFFKLCKNFAVSSMLLTAYFHIFSHTVKYSNFQTRWPKDLFRKKYHKSCQLTLRLNFFKMYILH